VTTLADLLEGDRRRLGLPRVSVLGNVGSGKGIMHARLASP